MENKLYTILRQFDKVEMNRLEKYIQSPYFNRHETIIVLFQIYKRNLDHRKEIELNKNDIWRKLQPTDKFDDVRFRKYNSDLLRLVEGYMAQQIYDENPLHQAIYLMDAVSRKKMDKLHNSTVRVSRQLSEKQPFKPANYYFYQYQIERNFYKLTDFESKRDDRSNIEEIINNLDYFYLAEKLQYYLEILTRQRVISHEYKVLFIEEILTHLEKQQYDNIPPISLYYQVFLTQKEPENEQHYFKFQELITEHIDKFPPEEAYSLYRIALNYCISKLNKGSIPFTEEYLAIYEKILKNRAILEKVELTSSSFRNTVVAAARLKRYEWAEKFIENFQDKLPLEERENTVNTNLATVYFYQRKFDQVIKLLQTAEFPDVIANFNAKTVLLMTYYELDETDLLFSFVESFKVFVSRHSNIAYEKRLDYFNLIKYVKKLTEMMPRDKKTLLEMKEEIQTNKNVASRNWLLEKVEAMSQRR
ncbi:MAG: hypothetical protein ACOYOA_12225 [Saprospiraceae bacterium]